MVSVRIKKLRQKFAENNIDGYIIPKNDEYLVNIRIQIN